MPDTDNTANKPEEGGYSRHPCTELFPPMSPEQEADLLADIERNGLRDPIITDQRNRIVDGTRRYDVCTKLGVKLKIDQRNLTDDEAWSLSISRNLCRRHLSEATRAAISAEARKAANLPVTQAEAAQAFNISERTLRSAEAVFDASPDLHRAVKNDQLSVHAAEKIAKLAPAQRAAAISKVKQGDTQSAKALTKPATTSAVKKPVAARAAPRKTASTAPGKKTTTPFKGSAVYAPLFGELDLLADHLAAYPLAPADAQHLIAQLRRAIERIETAIK